MRDKNADYYVHSIRSLKFVGVECDFTFIQPASKLTSKCTHSLVRLLRFCQFFFHLSLQEKVTYKLNCCKWDRRCAFPCFVWNEIVVLARACLRSRKRELIYLAFLCFLRFAAATVAAAHCGTGAAHLLLYDRWIITFIRIFFNNPHFA